jgi:uncharacterized protein (DUF427 family)
MESVWDYPRPPRCEATAKEIAVMFNNVEIARTRRAYRVLETSHPPVYYIPPEDVRMECMQRSNASSFCEWKGSAGYYDVSVNGSLARQAAWFYASPTAPFAAIKNHIAFYPQKMQDCFVNGEKVIPQPGRFYGGWITSDIQGPFKGEGY